MHPSFDYYDILHLLLPLMYIVIREHDDVLWLMAFIILSSIITFTCIWVQACQHKGEHDGKARPTFAKQTVYNNIYITGFSLSSKSFHVQVPFSRTLMTKYDQKEKCPYTLCDHMRICVFHFRAYYFPKHYITLQSSRDDKVLCRSWSKLAIFTTQWWALV
jgi:hypothetical protein